MYTQFLMIISAPSQTVCYLVPPQVTIKVPRVKCPMNSWLEWMRLRRVWEGRTSGLKALWGKISSHSPLMRRVTFAKPSWLMSRNASEFENLAAQTSVDFYNTFHDTFKHFLDITHVATNCKEFLPCYHEILHIVCVIHTILLPI